MMYGLETMESGLEIKISEAHISLSTATIVLKTHTADTVVSSSVRKVAIGCSNSC